LADRVILSCGLFFLSSLRSFSSCSLFSSLFAYFAYKIETQKGRGEREARYRKWNKIGKQKTQMDYWHGQGAGAGHRSLTSKNTRKINTQQNNKMKRLNLFYFIV